MSIPTSDILQHYGIDFSDGSQGNLKFLCPFHDDKNPSCYIKIDNGQFFCHGCGANGNIYQLLKKKLGKDVRSEVNHKFGISSDRTIKVEVIEKCHRSLSRYPHLLTALYDHGLTPELIDYYRIGADSKDQRITIPIKNESGLYVAVRRYLPGASYNKMLSQKYRGQNRFYPIEQLAYDKIVLTGGELKAIVAAYWLNSHGIGAITGTHGESNITVEMAQQLKGKVVYVCMDIDDAGKAAATKIAGTVVRFAKQVYIVDLPLDKKRFPKGDINDLVMSVDTSDNRFLYDIVTSGKEYTFEPVDRKELNGELPKEVDLSVAVEGEYVGYRISCQARVTAICDKPYEIPSHVTVSCDKSESFCSLCPVFPKMPDEIYKIPQESKAIISMCGAHEKIQTDEIKDAIGIPIKCKKCSFNATKHYAIQEARLSNVLTMTQRASSSNMMTAFCVGSNLEANSEYTFTGRNYPHQRDQFASFVFSKYEPLEDELSTYTADNVKSLDIFQPKEWTGGSIIEKLHDIYKDIEANVTYIYERRRMHLMVDLAYHSPLQFVMDNQLQKGWVEVLMVGDSSIGKTQICKNLRDHYCVGRRTSCKGATPAGLLGGLQAIGGRWFVTWGIVPTYDKQLVILEELSGVKEGTIQSLTDMRSTGIAELTKIEKRSTHARTRLIAISNPVTGRNVMSYTFGIQAIEELIKAPEDIRRFDFCIVESQNDIPAERISELQSYRPQVEHTYTSDLCRELILWGWSRDHNQVEFDKDALDEIGQSSTYLCNKYTDVCPIIDKGSTRYKIARLAASLAVRTFSHIDYEKIRVRKCHVDAVVKILDDTYSCTTIGYSRFSESVRYQTSLQDPKIVATQMHEVPNPKDFATKLMHCHTVDIQDIADWTGYDTIAARRVISLLVRKNCLIREGRTYKKNETFNRFLHELIRSNTLPEVRTSVIGEVGG